MHLSYLSKNEIYPTIYLYFVISNQSIHLSNYLFFYIDVPYRRAGPGSEERVWLWLLLQGDQGHPQGRPAQARYVNNKLDDTLV